MSRAGGRPQLELWAGPECTVARVGDRYVDQFALSGHDRRIGDLDLLAGLGVRAVRYPVLWEKTAPKGLATADWSWADERLGRLRELGIRPIVGLVHHGSGPPHTSLVDDSFWSGLAEYARAAAERYPWVEEWTPVNEPLTTARFSALYGHWYPHGRTEASFVRALLVQCRAVVECMRAIRSVIPDAKLIQTDDLGKTFSTPLLAYQAEFENERRWLGFELLTGRVEPTSDLGVYLKAGGATDHELDWLAENACPPDVMGINHYLSSERFLDERLDRYPADAHGGNERHRYADVLAARVAVEGPAGPEQLLREAWERYGLPIAVTEVHNGCTRDDQLRWAAEVWDAAGALREQGVDVRAVTLWSAFGTFDWHRMLTTADGHYEPGAFDVRAPEPRATVLARFAESVSRGQRFEHPVLETPGWWRRRERLFYPPVSVDGGRARDGDVAGPPIVVTGARGTLGQAFARLCTARGLAHVVLARDEMDIADPASVGRALAAHQPWAVVNAAGFVRVDDAESEVDKCFRENAEGPGVLAAACARQGVRLVTFSSDLVFDGAKGEPYVESDAVAPVSVYGRAKAEGETRALAADPTALVVRASAFFGPWDEHNFVAHALAALRSGERFAAADDAIVSPTYVPDLVHTTLDLLIDGESGIWHLANEGAVSWADFAAAAAEAAGLSPDGIERVSFASLGLPAPRPAFSALASERGWLMPAWHDALGRYARAHETNWNELPSGSIAVRALR